MLVAVPALLYVPAVQTWTVCRVVSVLNADDDASFRYQIGHLHIVFPFQLQVDDIAAVRREDGSIFFSLGRLSTGLLHFPLGDHRMLSLGQTELLDLQIGMDDLSETFGMSGSAGLLSVTGLSVDLSEENVLIERVFLDDADLAILLRERVDSMPDNSDPFGWNIKINELTIVSSAFQMDMPGDTLAPYFDYNHFRLDSLAICARDFCYCDTLLCLSLRSLSGHEVQSSMQIDQAAVRLAVRTMEDDGSMMISAEDLDLATPTSSLSGNLQFNVSTLHGHGALEGALSRQDLLAVVPAYQPSFSVVWPDLTTRFSVCGVIDADSISVPHLKITMPSCVDLQGALHVAQWQDSLALLAQGNVQGSFDDGDRLISALVRGQTGRSWHVPRHVTCDARLRYAPDEATLAMEVTEREATSEPAGLHRPILPRISLSASCHPATMRYRANLLVQDFDVKHWVDDIPIGSVGLRIDVEGKGTDLTSSATILHTALRLDSLWLTLGEDSRINVTEVSGEVHQEQGAFSIAVRSDYPALRFDANLSGQNDRRAWAMAGFLHLDHVDLIALSADMGLPEAISEHVDHLDSLLFTMTSDVAHSECRLSGGDAMMSVSAPVSLLELPQWADRLMAEVQRQTELKELDLGAISSNLPELLIDFDMARANPVFPIVQAYGIEFDQASLSVRNDSSLLADIAISGLFPNADFCLDTIDFTLGSQPARRRASDYFYFGRVSHRDADPALSFVLPFTGVVQPDSLTAHVSYHDGTGARVCGVSSIIYHLTDSLAAYLTTDSIPLALLNLLMAPDVTMTGSAVGDFTASAHVADIERSLRLDGSLAFSDARVSMPAYGLTLDLPADTLNIRDNVLQFNRYEMIAGGGGRLRLGGKVDFSDQLTDPKLSLNLRADNARLLHKARRQSAGQMLAGTLPVTADVNVRGPVSRLAVTGRISLLEGTDLTYWLDDDPMQTASQMDEMVDFVSFDEIDHSMRLADSLGTAPMLPAGVRRESATAAKWDADLQIEINRAVKVMAYLPGTDDSHASFTGGGSLQLGVSSAGSTTLNGTYDLTGGTILYKLPSLPVTKEFTIESGSYAAWMGGPAADPVLHIVAGQKIRTTVSDQTRGTRVVTLDARANIDGTLSHLDVTFDCTAPDDAAIEAELSAMTPDERSNQALMLLLTQTYMGPSASSASSVGLSSASSAVTNLVNKQLDELTAGLKHTNIDFGMDSYNTDAGDARTDLSLKVSQTLFNDRVRVSVGGKMLSSQNSADATSQQEAVMGDASIDWMIRRDGAQYLSLFRRTSYQNILEGQVVEMGVGYGQERQGYSFWKLFLPSSLKRQMLIQQYQRQMHEAQGQE